MSSTAAANPGTSPGSGQFPLKLAQAVLEDILKKGLEASLNPSDEGKTLAYVAGQAALPRRLAILTSQIAAADKEELVEGFCELVEAQWSVLHRHPGHSRVQLSWLEGSAWLAAFTTLFEAVCAASTLAKETLCNGGPLLCHALGSLSVGADDGPDILAQLEVLVEWWGDEVCSRRWGVTDAWGFCEIEGARYTPLSYLIWARSPALVTLAIEKGCPVDGDWERLASARTPIASAFGAGYLNVVKTLINKGANLTRPCKGDGWPVFLRMVSSGAGKSDFLADLVKRKPELLTATSVPTDADDCAVAVLDAAIMSCDVELVEAMLAAGAAVSYRYARASGHIPTLSVALRFHDAAVFNLLLTKEKLLENWADKYDQGARVDIAASLARVAVSAYPPNPECSAEKTGALPYSPDAMASVEVVLASGIVVSWDEEGNNALFPHLFLGNAREDALKQGCALEEAHALALLKRYHRAGVDVVRGNTCASGSDSHTKTVPLLHLAAAVGYIRVLDWCLGELGVPADLPEGDGVTPLALALNRHRVACALFLLDKYKVRASYPGRPLAHQPVTALMQRLTDYTDAEAESVLRALVSRDPSLFDLEYFSERSLAAHEALHDDPGVIGFFASLVLQKMPRSLEFLLSSSLPGVAAMATRVASKKMPAAEGPTFRVTALQVAASLRRWESAELLLRYTPARVTFAVDGCPSAALIIKHTATGPDAAPRALVALVEARAQQEIAEDAARQATVGESAAQGPGATAVIETNTNAFEDPSVKPFDEKEAKRKAKKKAAKKKAKAKKRAATASGAGGTGAAHRDTDSDDSSIDGGEEEEEEPDDNLVDSRNAPSLDILLAQMGFKKQ